MKRNTRNRGRPKQNVSATETLPPIRVTPQQKSNYKLAAEAAGLSLSAWFKTIADEKSRMMNESN